METGTLVHVAPSTLLIDANIRTTVKLDPTFKASIASNGVLEPVVAVATEEGLRVRMGQRRTLAAIEVGRETIPVYVVADDGDADRIIGQLAENEHRDAITNGERIEAVQQLSLLGVPAAQIAKRTHLKRKDIDTAVAIIGDDKALKVATEHTLTVAGWCQEFADDPEKVKQILQQAEWNGEGGARHTVERYRQEAKDEAAYLEAAATITDQPLIRRPSWSDKAKNVDELKHGAKNLTAAAHKACPARAVVLTELRAHDRRKPDFEAAGRKWALEEYCTDPEANGHASRWGGSLGGKSSSTDPKDKEKEAAERRRVIAGNKAWDASTVVRAEFVATLLARKAVPEGAVLFALRALTDHVNLSDGRDALCKKLGITKAGYGALAIPDIAAPAATMALLAYLVAVVEKACDRAHWRKVNASTAAYFRALESWGYTLSDVETAAAGGKKFTLPAPVKKAA